MYMNKLKNNKLLQNLDVKQRYTEREIGGAKVQEKKRAREQDIKKVVDWKSTRASE
jgi:hypothetical protein